MRRENSAPVVRANPLRPRTRPTRTVPTSSSGKDATGESDALTCGFACGTRRNGVRERGRTTRCSDSFGPDAQGRDQGLFGPGLALFLTHFRRTRTEVGWRVASCAAVLSRVPRTEAPGRPRSSRRTTRRWTGRRAGVPTWGTGYCSVPGGATPELPGEAPAHRRYGPHRNLSEVAVGHGCAGARGPGGWGRSAPSRVGAWLMRRKR